jgi:hypothetical protein
MKIATTLETHNEKDAWDRTSTPWQQGGGVAAISSSSKDLLQALGDLGGWHRRRTVRSGRIGTGGQHQDENPSATNPPPSPMLRVGLRENGEGFVEKA